jgi:hypothetical protein
VPLRIGNRTKPIAQALSQDHFAEHASMLWAANIVERFIKKISELQPPAELEALWDFDED